MHDINWVEIAVCIPICVTVCTLADWARDAWRTRRLRRAIEQAKREDEARYGPEPKMRAV